MDSELAGALTRTPARRAKFIVGAWAYRKGAPHLRERLLRHPHHDAALRLWSVRACAAVDACPDGLVAERGAR